jgi:aspartate aminotransferase
VPAPPKVNQSIKDVLDEEDSTLVHGYMSNAGYDDVKEAIAKSLNKRFDLQLAGKNIIMTAGAAAGMNGIFKALLDPNDEVVTFAPYFLEYRNYASNYDAKLVEVAPDTKTFQPDIEALKNTITEKTKIVLINSPHNPTGVIYSEETIIKLAQALKEKQEEYGHSIVLIADEPYRELAYNGTKVPWVTKYYDNTVVVYSYSKSLSLPGERIGYLVIPDSLEDCDAVIAATTIACRVLGFVNAPSLMQRAIQRCLEEEADIAFYEKNMKLLYDSLTSYGFTCVKPEGAFYLFMKSPIADEKEFCEEAKKHNILVVPGSSFACSGYVRIAYCVAYETIVNSLPGFQKLAAQYNLTPQK